MPLLFEQIQIGNTALMSVSLQAERLPCFLQLGGRVGYNPSEVAKPVFPGGNVLGFKDS